MWITWTSVLLVLLFTKSSFQQEDYDDGFQSSDVSVKKFWGMQSATTSVGMLFHYKIPSDAFKGFIVSYDVKGEEEKSLPNWMIFDKNTSVLEGVPSENDIGDTQINVRAYDNKGRFVSDMFVVEVFPLLEKNTNNKRKCKKGEGVMMMELIIDKNLDVISPSHKIAALKNISRYLEIPVNTLLLLSQKLNADSLSNYPQEVENQLNSSVLTWQIGCNDRIWAEKLRLVELVKKHTNDSILAEVLQLPISHWRLVSSFNPFRKRRHITTNSTTSLNSKTTSDLDDNAAEDYNDDNENVEDNEDSETDDEIQDTEDTRPIPIPTEYSSSVHMKQHFIPSPVEKHVIMNTDNPNHMLNKSINEDILIPRNNISPNEEDSTETPDELDEDSARFNDSDYNVSATPDLPSNTSSLNNSVISISPINTLTEVDNTTTAESKHYPPQVVKNIDTWIVVAGKPYIKQIPEDVFTDEDGNTRNLTLQLIKPEQCTPYTSWIELNADKQEVNMLASLETISRHEFTIVATDSDGMSANNSLVIAVQYPQNALKINFEISLHMKLAENQNLTVSLQFELLQRITKLYGDSDPSNITVRNVSCNPFVFTWTNNTLSLDQCDNTTILSLLNVFTDSERSMDVNRKVQQEIGLLVEVEKVTWQGIGLCNSVIPAARLPQPPKQNFKPIVHTRIDVIRTAVGELTVYQVPENAFYDADVQNMRDLKLRLFTNNHTPVPAENWLQFDETNREIYGIPMNADVGSVNYQLECEDNDKSSSGVNVRQVFEVIVNPVAKTPYNVEFSLTLSSSYDEFNKSPSLRRTFVEKLAKLFGDKNSSSIVLSGYMPGSVIITWHNKSLSVDRCQETEIEQLRRILLNDEMKLNENVNIILGPEFEATSALVTPIGICEGGLTEFHSTETNVPSQEMYPNMSYSNLLNLVNEYFFEVILPVIIIVFMMLFASIIACVLYRKQRSAKWTLGDERERRSYRNKGIPVIFQDELEERLEPSNKSPIILKEEKPPLPPPEYQKTLPMATTALLSDFDDPSYPQGGVTSFTPRSADRNGRSKGTPIYRKPPPYAPP